MTLTIAAGPAAAAPASFTAAGSCTPYVAVLVPGTWETTASADPNVPVGMLAPIGNGLKAKYGSQIRVVFPAYPASAFDQGKTYGQSEAAGVAAVDQVLSAVCSSAKVLLGGYSQGAQVAGDVASAIGNDRGPIPASQVAGVGLVADPKRAPGQAELVGPTVPGTGIAGGRPSGFGQLSAVTREICAPADLYCATSGSQDGILGALGHVLGNTAAPTAADPAALLTGAAPDAAETTAGQSDSSQSTPSGADELGGADGLGGAAASGDGASSASDLSAEAGSALVSDFSRANLPGLVSAPQAMAQRIAALPTSGAITAAGQATQVASVGAAATSLVDTLTPLQNVAQFAAANPSATRMLGAAPKGSPQADAAQVLTAASKIDLPQAISTATSIADTATTLLAGGAGIHTPGTAAAAEPVARDALTGPVSALSSQLGPLSGVNASTLQTASGVLAILKPETLVGQVVNVGSNMAQLAANLPRIGTDLAALPGRIAAGDIDGAHHLAGDLNNAFSPIVKMAATVDFHDAASVIGLIPDPSGYCQIAALVLNLLGNVDVIRLANDIGQAQETAWAALKNPAALAGLLPIGLDLASVATGVLTGGSKTDPSQLGAMTAAAGQSGDLVAAAQSQNLAGLGTQLTSLASSQGAQDLTSLAKQGLDAASFYASGAHQSYGKFDVAGGQSAIAWLLSFFTKALTGDIN